MTVGILCLFLTMPMVGLQCVIVAFPGHTQFLGSKVVVLLLLIHCLELLPLFVYCMCLVLFLYLLFLSRSVQLETRGPDSPEALT